jgi:predicted permease
MPALTGLTDILTDRRHRRFHLVGRLADGQTVTETSARLASLASLLAEQFPEAWRDMNGETRALTVLDHRDSLAPPGAREELVLGIVVTSTLVLLIILLACTNVAGLLLGRAVARQHEVAVRLTLGATRRRLGAQLLTESLLLGLAGGTLGMLAVKWVTDFARTFPLLDGFDLRPDWRVLQVAFALSLLCPLLFGLAPMLQSIRLDVQAGLRGRANTVQRNRLRGVLIAAQVTVSCVFIQLALHAARGVRNHMNADPGIALDNLLVVQLELRGLARDSARVNAYIEQVREGVAAVPGVRNVATTHLLPFGNVTTYVRANRPDGEPLPIEENEVSENFFETVALQPIEGRVTDARDRASSRKVAVVNREFARAWGAPVVGRTIEFERLGSYEIVGVVDNVQYHQNRESHRPLVYFVADAPRPFLPPALLIRIQPGAEGSIAAALLPSLREQFPDVVAPSVETMRGYLAKQTQPQQISARAALGIGAAELAMATIGLYGLLLFAVSARTREMGVRLALGATASHASWAVLRSGLTYAGAGAILGLMLGVPSALLLGQAILGERAEDPVPVIAAIASVTVASLLAALVPAVRARRTEPAVALRHE